jgi:hypothetical protein
MVRSTAWLSWEGGGTLLALHKKLCWFLCTDWQVSWCLGIAVAQKRAVFVCVWCASAVDSHHQKKRPFIIITKKLNEVSDILIAK